VSTVAARPNDSGERRNPYRSSLVIEPMGRRVGMAALTLAVYVAAFVPLYRQGGVGVSALSIFPVVILGWLFGAWGGLLGGVLSVPLNAALLTLVGEPGWVVVVGAGGGEGSALVLVVGCVVGLLRDLGVRLDRQLTEWRRAERALHDSEDRYRMLFERSRDPMYVSRPDGRFVDANDAMVRLFGYSRSELIDIDIETLYEDADDRRAFSEKIRRDGFVADFPVRLLTQDGEVRECVVSATARLDGDQVREYQGSVRDVSEHGGLHQLAERRTRELREAVAELESFSYSVSHDLRSHLVTMGGFASLLWEDHREDLSDQGREFLSRIVAAGKRMDRFVHDMLEFSKVNRRELELQTVDLDEVVRDVVEALAGPIAEQGAGVEVRTPLGAVRADPGLVTRVFENLLTNALKFIDPARAPEIRISASREGHFVRVEVSDNGIGIDERDEVRAFRAFERLDSTRFPGTGVGLAIVQRAIERMGGEVGVRSRAGEGSTFWITLPPTASPPPAP
jgi:PAS domain S-box-containing protein